MLKITKFIIFISINFSLFGCDILFEDKSPIYIKMKNNIKINELKKISEIIEGEWENICIMRPYHGFISGLDEKKMEIINKKISQSDLIIDEGHWHFVLSKDEQFHVISFKRNRKLDVEQINFSQKQINYFKKINFSPEFCPSFNQAAIFKFQRSDTIQPEHIRIYITLGAIVQ